MAGRETGTDAEHYSVVLATAGSGPQADSIARALVERRLAACVNILGPICSVFRWEGKVQTEEERVLLIKAPSALYPEIAKTILELHSYECPEILQLPVQAGLEDYLACIGSSTGQATGD